MYAHAAQSSQTTAQLKRGERDIQDYINKICDRIDLVEPGVQALLPEEDRRGRLLLEVNKVVILTGSALKMLILEHSIILEVSLILLIN